MITKESIQVVRFLVATSVAASGFAADELKTGTAPESAAHDKEDKTGTNPLNSQNTLQFKNEFNEIGGEYARTNFAAPAKVFQPAAERLPMPASDFVLILSRIVTRHAQLSLNLRWIIANLLP